MPSDFMSVSSLCVRNRHWMLVNFPVIYLGFGFQNSMEFKISWNKNRNKKIKI